MGEVVFLIAMVGIGILIGYNVALAEGEDFKERFRNFFNLRKPHSKCCRPGAQRAPSRDRMAQRVPSCDRLALRALPDRTASRVP
jgi:hypothetical protein